MQLYIIKIMVNNQYCTPLINDNTRHHNYHNDPPVNVILGQEVRY